MRSLNHLAGAGSALAVSLAVACGGGADAGGLSGRITVDGSSTVQPISAAMAEEFQLANRGVQVTVGTSGTGGGFQKFCNGETDITNASRPIKESEVEACRANGIEPIEIAVAWDGLTVVKNPANDWLTCLTVDELRRIWQPGSTIRRWNQVRDGWPDRAVPSRSPSPWRAGGARMPAGSRAASRSTARAPSSRSAPPWPRSSSWLTGACRSR